MPFALLGLIAGGASLLGAGISGSAAESAANTQAQAAEQAAKIQQQEFNQFTQQEQPFLNTGYGANSLLSYGLGTGPAVPGAPTAGVTAGSLVAPFNPANLASTPGYQFQMDQGLQALLDSRTATGGVGGGNTLKAITEFGQGLASTSYQQQLADYMAQQSQQFGELSSVAGSGQGAAVNLGAAGQNYATSAGNDLTSAAAAKAAGTVGAGNAASAGITGAGNNFLLSQILSGSMGGSGAAAGYGGGYTLPAS
jgi:hypothetical protein